MISDVLAVSVTDKGRTLASSLPFPAAHGNIGDAVRDRWNDVSGFVLFLATGAATRIVAPLLSDKSSDPAVVCVDEAGRYAVALCGGHAAGANELALRVADILGAEPVITTATDRTGLPALDCLRGFTARGDLAGVTTAWLDGCAPEVVNPLGWPLPASLTKHPGSRTTVTVTDQAAAPKPGHVTLHPPSLIAGIGASTGAPVVEVHDLLQQALADAGLAPESLAEVATLDRKAAEPAIVALDLPIRSFDATSLARVEVPSPSSVVAAAVGTPSVCEAAALLAAGEGAELVVPKRAGSHSTVAIARRRHLRGHLSLVGLGPGGARHRTPAAELAIRQADVIIGYGSYLSLCADLIDADQATVASPIGDEIVRAKHAVTEACAGRRVVLVCSGDSGVYGMASITLEVVATEAAPIDVEVVPGVTAALAAAALLGAPLGHDHAVISLSDLLTPWTTIERRLRAAAQGDLVVAMYNPRSHERQWQLSAACSILLESRPPSTPVGVVTAATRDAENIVITTLGELDPAAVGMTTCVVVGSSTTRVLAGHMVTPRGYDP